MRARGGILVTDDPELAAYAILAAGSYELLYQKHLARPDDTVFEKIKLEVPNFSLRMSNLTAAVLRPQIPELDEKILAYNEFYSELETLFDGIEQVKAPAVLPQVSRVGDSFQFNLVGMTSSQVQDFLNRAQEQGIELQIFGHHDNARYFRNWKYSYNQMPELDKTEEIITAACDFRIPLTFSQNDLALIASIVEDLLSEINYAPEIRERMKA